MNRRGSIIVEAVIVLPLILCILVMGIKGFIVLREQIGEYYETLENTYEEAITESIEVIRIDKALSDQR